MSEEAKPKVAERRREVASRSAPLAERSLPQPATPMPSPLLGRLEAVAAGDGGVDAIWLMRALAPHRNAQAHRTAIVRRLQATFGNHYAQRLMRQVSAAVESPLRGMQRQAGAGEARAVSGEAGMAFAGYPQQQGWAFLAGPGGSAGHRWNEPGFDGVAFRKTGQLEIHILDNKSFARRG